MEKPKKNICECGGRLVLHKSTFEQYQPSMVECNKCTTSYTVGDNDFRNSMIDEMDTYLSHKEKMGKWISVDERLPEFGDMCTIFFKDGFSGVGFGILYNGIWKLLTIEGISELNHVTLWQPLPEPPLRKE